mmetsp:Transcript_72595/g.173239  ORF Transcript_72595/g.173239 Transcript_72595/m.173239 type:complete len:275 (+) Transcript_72595:2279-3103(+)
MGSSSSSMKVPRSTCHPSMSSKSTVSSSDTNFSSKRCGPTARRFVLTFTIFFQPSASRHFHSSCSSLLILDLTFWLTSPSLFPESGSRKSSSGSSSSTCMSSGGCPKNSDAGIRTKKLQPRRSSPMLKTLGSRMVRRRVTTPFTSPQQPDFLKLLPEGENQFSVTKSKPVPGAGGPPGGGGRAGGGPSGTGCIRIPGSEVSMLCRVRMEAFRDVCSGSSFARRKRGSHGSNEAWPFSGSVTSDRPCSAKGPLSEVAIAGRPAKICFNASAALGT